MSNQPADQELRFKELISANQESNRYRWALEWKRQGKKVIGITNSYVPEEIIYACGMLPFRITGTWQPNPTLARYYRPEHVCPYCTHVLQSLLLGELDFLDGLILTDWDDDERRLYDVCKHIGRFPFTVMLHVPHQDSELAYRYFTRRLNEIATELEKLGGDKLTKGSLQHAIETHNETRTLLMNVYELRKRERPAISGSEALGLTTAATVMPKEEFNRELKGLLNYLENREAPLSKVHPRLLVTSDRLDNPAYLELIEQAGVVAMDDLDTGSRYFWKTVDTDLEPVYALAKRYISHPACPRMFFWDQQVEQVIKWVSTFNIDGVLHLPLMHSLNRLSCVPYFQDRLKEVNIPVATFQREYPLVNVGQLRTRVEAFVEMLEARA